MRTTLSIEDDVALALERLRKTREESLKTIVNEALRRGIREMASRPKARVAFRTKAVSLGRVRSGIDNIAETLARVASESFK